MVLSCSACTTSQVLAPRPVHRQELCYFGVKVAMIEPGYFITNMTQGDSFLENLLTSWNPTSPEMKELYGDNFIADCE